MDHPLIRTRRKARALPARHAPDAAGEAGFSLLEMVIVVAVLAVLAVSVGLSAARVLGRDQADAARFQAQFARERHLAIIGRNVRGLSLSPEGWRAMTRAAPAPAPDAAPSPANPFAAARSWRVEGRLQRFQGEVRVTGLPRAPGADLPDLAFLPDGRVTPVSIAFISAGAITRCETDGWSDLACATE